MRIEMKKIAKYIIKYANLMESTLNHSMRILIEFILDFWNLDITSDSRNDLNQNQFLALIIQIQNF